MGYTREEVVKIRKSKLERKIALASKSEAIDKAELQTELSKYETELATIEAKKAEVR